MFDIGTRVATSGGAIGHVAGRVTDSARRTTYRVRVTTGYGDQVDILVPADDLFEAPEDVIVAMPVRPRLRLVPVEGGAA